MLDSKSSSSRLALSENQGVPTELFGMTVFRKGVTQKLDFSGKHYVKIHNKHAPLTHDLRKLSKLSNIELEEHHKDWMDTITAFNLNARL